MTDRSYWNYDGQWHPGTRLISISVAEPLLRHVPRRTGDVPARGKIRIEEKGFTQADLLLL